jgi:hypothetical protein
MKWRFAAAQNRPSAILTLPFVCLWQIMTTLFVGNISNRTTDRDLEECFHKFGAVKSIVRSGKGFGFVVIAEARDARAAVEGLNGQNLLGRIIRVEHSTRGGKSDGRKDSGGVSFSYANNDGYGGGSLYGGGGGYGNDSRQVSEQITRYSKRTGGYDANSGDSYRGSSRRPRSRSPDRSRGYNSRRHRSRSSDRNSSRDHSHSRSSHSASQRDRSHSRSRSHSCSRDQGSLGGVLISGLRQAPVADKQATPPCIHFLAMQEDIRLQKNQSHVGFSGSGSGSGSGSDDSDSTLAGPGSPCNHPPSSSSKCWVPEQTVKIASLDGVTVKIVWADEDCVRDLKNTYIQVECWSWGLNMHH